MGELNHECGVAAVYHAAGRGVSSLAPTPGEINSVARLVPRMLLDIQNRGQLAAGMSSYHPGRRALLRLYARGLYSDDAVADAAVRSEGTTASFAKELVRRAVLLAAASGAEPADEHLAAALDGLLSDQETLTRSLMGVGVEASGRFPEFGPPGF